MIEKKETVEAIETILRGAGDIVMSYYQCPFSFKRKPEGTIVTPADVDSEHYLIEHLGKIMPHACYFAEESGRSGEPNEYCWVIDPLDGTTNFAHGIPYFSISVALTLSDVPVFGAIYNPAMNDYFYALQGGGAFYNGTKIKVTDGAPLYNRVFIASGPTRTSVQAAQLINKLQNDDSRSYSVRQLGSSALDIAYVAAGKADAVFFQGLSWWDVAAGLVMIMEAEGVATTYQGDQITPSYTSCVAGGARMHGMLQPLLSELIN